MQGRRTRMRVAFLGLGIMGRPMAANLVKAGHELSVWNRTPGKDVEGARSAASPAEAAAGAEVAWMCVSDTKAVESVLFGQQGVEQSLTLSTKLGVNAETLLPVVQASMVHSGVVEYKAPFVLKRDFTPNFPLRLMHKDIQLALEAAKEVRAKLPGLETVEEIYEMATEDGHGNLDYAATLTLLEKWAGVEVKGASA